MSDTTPRPSQDQPTGATAPDQVSDVAAMKRELDEKQDRLLRALAEMDNMRRRAQRDRDDYTRYATESLIRDLVPIVDNFDRALEAARGNLPGYLLHDRVLRPAQVAVAVAPDEDAA